MNAVKEHAYAKINLHLDVISKRGDGFHDIKTVMHSVSLADVVKITYQPAKEISVTMSIVGAAFLPTDKRNLAVRAAYTFLERASINAAVHIKLEKNIPIAAGLAGGSSDAAAVLRGLNKLAGKIFTEKALISIASELGSDVPYCLIGKTVLCEGRGEILTRLACLPKLNVVLAIGNEHVSTPAAYSALDLCYSNFDGTKNTGGEKYFEELMKELETKNSISEKLFNVFEIAVLPSCEIAKKIKGRMIELGAKCSIMSGSGPSVFGIFNSEDEAKKAADILSSEGVNAYFTTSV